MFNNLGIFSNNLIRVLRPGINIRRPMVRTVQLAAGRRRGGVNTIGGATPTPPPLLLTVTGTTPQTTTEEDGLVTVTGMTLTWPITSNALATFTADYSIVGDLVDITAAAAAATTALAAQLAALPGGVPHGAIFGNGEVLLPGIYDVAGAAAIQGVLTLDAQGDPDALFVIRTTGALTSVAGSTVSLVNGADPANVFWRSTGATALGANTVFSGTAVAVGGAAGIGNSSVVNGRLLSTLGAVTTDTSIVNQPGETTTAIILNELGNFALFTNSGAVTNTGTSVINGNIGTNLGLITGFGLPTVVNGNVYIPGSLAAGAVEATFALYVNGVLNAGSLVTVAAPTTIPPSEQVTTSATLALVPGDIVTARSQVIQGTMTVTNRTLSLLQVP